MEQGTTKPMGLEEKAVLLGAIGGLIGTLVLNWYSVNLLFTNVQVSAWQAGGLGKLAVLVGLALAATSALRVAGMDGQLPFQYPQASRGLAVVLLILTVLQIVQRVDGASIGLFVALVSGGVATWGAQALIRNPPAATPPAAASAPQPATTLPSTVPTESPRGALGGPERRFCSECGFEAQPGARHCSRCGARLREM